jgi:hypothetical protein
MHRAVDFHRYASTGTSSSARSLSVQIAVVAPSSRRVKMFVS